MWQQMFDCKEHIKLLDNKSWNKTEFWMICFSQNILADKNKNFLFLYDIFYLTQVFVLDVDECLTENNCHFIADCNNTDGSYTCTCKDGYVGDGTFCNGND